MRDFSGQSLGRYHLIEKLGEGGMAVVYKAFDTRLECEVAVKIIRVEDLPQSGVERALKRFEREAKAVAQLNHPNIVRVMDYGEQDGLPFLVMPYQPGGTLKGVLGKPIPYQEAAHLLAPVARALQYAHSRNIVHRDVKPSNILITESGEPMLTDFGIAKILDLNDGQTLTGTGVGIGTPEYMAPEQWEGKPVDGRADIYALGVVLYEMITGRPPYKADTVPATMVQVLRDPLPRPSSFVPGLPVAIEQILIKALAKNPEDRYQSMQDLEKYLQDLSRETALKSNSTLQRSADTSNESNPILFDTFKTYEDLSKSVNNETERKQFQTGVVTPTDKSIYSNHKARKMPHWSWIGLGISVFVIMLFLIGRTTNWFHIASQVPQTVISMSDGMESELVPAGNYSLISIDGVEHKMYMDDYYIDKTEVTNEMYEKCVSAGVCTEPIELSSYTHASYYGDPAYSNYPVINVNWLQAQTYCEWAGRALPTEAQWEKAAKGTKKEMYPWGDELPNINLANFGGFNGDVLPVGSFPAGASPYGALDMAGNVWEWTSGEGINNDPDLSNSSKTIKGGDWYSIACNVETYQIKIDGLYYLLPEKYIYNQIPDGMFGAGNDAIYERTTGNLVIDLSGVGLQLVDNKLVEINGVGQILGNDEIYALSSIGIAVDNKKNSLSIIDRDGLCPVKGIEVDQNLVSDSIGFRCVMDSPGF